MKKNSLIALMTLVWLVLMANIIWEGTDGAWKLTDVEKIAQLEVAKYANQIMVVSVLNEDAKLCLYERELNTVGVKEDMNMQGEWEEKMRSNAAWNLVLETEANIGKNGLGKKREGDGKTPVGIFCFVKAFGILENPGAKLEYTKVNEGHYWVDDSASKYYNQFVVIEEVKPDWVSAEHILEYGESYHYVLATSFNSDRISGAGSAIFLHCASDDADATAGCIAVPEVYMREIMKRVEPQCVLIIDYVENILLY